jgi:allantoinase
VAVMVGVAVQYFRDDEPSLIHSLVPDNTRYDPDLINQAWHDYGAQIGVWRLMDILDRHGIRASGPLNTEACLHYPEIVAAGVARGWDFMATAAHAAVRMRDLDAEAEQNQVLDAIKQLESSLGRRPKGWVTPAFAESPRTLDIVAQAGLEYTIDYHCDDQPTVLTARDGSVIAIPYSMEINDIGACLRFSMTAPEFEQLLRSQFDYLYAESATQPRFMSIGLHTYVGGQAHRAKHIDSALEYMKQHQDVWWPTAGEVNAWIRESTGATSSV